MKSILPSMKRLALVLISLALIPATAFGAHQHPEKFYQDKWCAEHHGKAEVSLPDETRADCITSNNAIEFDFAKKWYEAVGQALFYGLQTGKRPGIVLLIETPTDRKYFLRMNSTIDHFKLPIDTWEMRTGK